MPVLKPKVYIVRRKKLSIKERINKSKMSNYRKIKTMSFKNMLADHVWIHAFARLTMQTGLFARCTFMVHTKLQAYPTKAYVVYLVSRL